MVYVLIQNDFFVALTQKVVNQLGYASDVLHIHSRQKIWQLRTQIIELSRANGKAR